MQHIKCLFLFALLLCGLPQAYSKPKKSKNKAELTCDYKKLSGNAYDLIFKVNLKKGLYVKANNDYDSVSLKLPSITFNKGAFKPEGEMTSKGLIETKKLRRIGIVNLYTYTVLYNQRVTAEPGTTITGTYHYRICNENAAKRSKTENFSITVK